MTYSIVARDPDTGELGVAVQSHWFAVGSIVSWAEPGVGAIATQAFAEPAYGPRGLALLREEMAPREALAKLLLADPGREVRQVAFLDAGGRVATHTGAQCIEAAGHLAGDGWSVQANMMANDRVVPAMAAAWASARGELALRLLAVLDAAQAAGGDLRGMQSAAMVIVSKDARTVDVRVDDAAAPLAELRRLVGLARVYDHMNAGDRAVEVADLGAARDHYRAAAAGAPERLEVRYWQGFSLATSGDLAGSVPILREVFAADPSWIELTRRLPKAGLVPDGLDLDALLATILS